LFVGAGWSLLPLLRGGDVVVPSGPGAAFEVVEAEAVLEFAVVVFDAPADLRQAYELGDRSAEARWTTVSGRTASTYPLARSASMERNSAIWPYPASATVTGI
jgi:arginase family enzyme